MISAFEYVTVLISIILGLGITQILTSIADLFHKIQKVRFYWPHILWILFVLILHIQEWWVTYELKNHQPWRLPTFLFIILYPVNLFVLARMLFPSSLKGKRIDLKTFYLRNYRKIFSLFIASAVFSVAYNLFILDLAVSTQALQVLLK
jgi:peptidoglycan/LPS O-acetylase OafA/YrhL